MPKRSALRRTESGEPAAPVRVVGFEPGVSSPCGVSACPPSSPRRASPLTAALAAEAEAEEPHRAPHGVKDRRPAEGEGSLHGATLAEATTPRTPPAASSAPVAIPTVTTRNARRCVQAAWAGARATCSGLRLRHTRHWGFGTAPHRAAAGPRPVRGRTRCASRGRAASRVGNALVVAAADARFP